MFDTLTSAQKTVLAAVVLLAFAAALVGASGRLRPVPDAAEVVGYDPPVPGTDLVTVHVVGAVVRPGLYRIEAGSRVQDAVSAAGGFAPTARVDSVNLASWLTDGEQIFVETFRRAPAPVSEPQSTEQPVASPPAATPRARMTGVTAAVPPSAPARPVTRTPATATVPTPAPKPPICINTAGLEELQQLPGVGPTLARRILYYRHQNGRFRSFNQLGEVDGIGRHTIEEIRTCSTLN